MKKPPSPQLQTIKFLLTVFLTCFITIGHSQNEIKFWSDEKIKKENGLFGIKREKTWTVPAKYDRIEGYGGLTKVKDKLVTSNGGYAVCYRGNVIDIYEVSYNQNLVVTDLTPGQFELLRLYGVSSNIPLIKDQKWTNAVDEFTPAQKQLYQDFRGGRAFVKNGKWGFASKYFYVAPQFDSLFTICQEDATGKLDMLKCDEVVGIVADGKKGVADNQGKIIVLNKDYVNFRYKYTSGNGSFEVICLHKSGVEVNYNRYSETENIYIETQNKEGLKGYVYKGDFIAPKYTAIKKCHVSAADFECTLPDGSIEYRKGDQIVSADAIKKNVEKIAEDDKKKDELAAKEKELEIKKKDALNKIIETKEDSLVGSLMDLYFKQDKPLFDKVNALNEYLKSTMIQNTKGDFDRSQWPGRSLEIKNNYRKKAKDQLTVYESQLKSFQFVNGKLDLYTAIQGYLEEVNRFLTSSNSWADYISDMGGENNETKEEIGRLETSIKSMKMGYNFCKSLVTEYQNSKKTTGKYLTTMKAAKGEAAENNEMDPYEVVKIVRTGTTKDMLNYCSKYKLEFTRSEKDGNAEYNVKEPFVSGVKSFTDVKKEGLIVHYIFKDSEQKKKYQALWGKEGFTVKDKSSSTGLLTNNGVDIWFIPGTMKWMISKAKP